MIHGGYLYGISYKPFNMSNLKQIGGGKERITYLSPRVEVLDVKMEQSVLSGSGNTESLRDGGTYSW